MVVMAFVWFALEISCTEFCVSTLLFALTDNREKMCYAALGDNYMSFPPPPAIKSVIICVLCARLR